MEEKILLENCDKPLDKYAHLKTAQKRREYNHKFYENNKDKDIKRSCDICSGSYTIFNKSHHKKSKKHLKGIILKEKEKENPNPVVIEAITQEEGKTKLNDIREKIKKYQEQEKELKEKFETEGII